MKVDFLVVMMPYHHCWNVNGHDDCGNVPYASVVEWKMMKMKIEDGANTYDAGCTRLVFEVSSHLYIEVDTHLPRT